jgi:hypothetical protein
MGRLSHGFFYVIGSLNFAVLADVPATRDDSQQKSSAIIQDAAFGLLKFQFRVKSSHKRYRRRSSNPIPHPARATSSSHDPSRGSAC